MSNFPAIPLDQKTEKNVKLFLDGLAGRMGIEGRAVTFEDLFDAGIIQLKPGVTINNISDNTDPADVIDVPTGTLPDLPTVPTNLGATSSWGSIFLDWQYEAYNDAYGTEIWRSIVNDRDTANLIAVATGYSYTDMVGAQEIEYFYWVRNRSASNVVSGFNSFSGIRGSSNLKTTVADFIMARPEAEFKPFTIGNFGDDTNPIWKILLNADVLVAGDLAIGQLISGEMPEGVEFSIGNGSIVMSTDSGSGSALGSILITGDGGIVENDYLRITNGSIQAYVWDENSGAHVQYKELKRVERGQTQSGVQTQIKAYFKNEPKVYLSFEDISVFNVAYNTQNQKLVMKTGPILPSSPFDGSWYFTPRAYLAVESGLDTQPEPYNVYQTSDSGSYLSLHSFVTTQGVSATFTVGSFKLLASGDYQNRRITIYLDGSFNGGAQTQIGTTYVDVTGDGADFQVTIDVPVLTSGTWIFRYRFVAADRAGTTPGTGIIYEYDDDTSNTGDMLDLLTEPNDPVKQGEIVSYRPVRGAEWKLFEVDYEVTFDWQLEAWCVEVSGGSFPELEIGRTNISVPSVLTPMELNGNCNKGTDYALCSQYPYTNDSLLIDSANGVTAGTNGKITITENDPLYLAGKFTPNPVIVTGDNDPGGCLSGEYMGNGRGSLTITGYNVTYYYRKVVAQNLTVTNHFQVNTVTADKGAIDISLNTATINWLAAGE